MVIVGMKAKQKNLVNSMHRGADGIVSYEMVSPQEKNLSPFDTKNDIDLSLKMYYFSKSKLVIFPRIKMLKT